MVQAVERLVAGLEYVWRRITVIEQALGLEVRIHQVFPTVRLAVFNEPRHLGQELPVLPGVRRSFGQQQNGLVLAAIPLLFNQPVDEEEQGARPQIGYSGRPRWSERCQDRVEDAAQLFPRAKHESLSLAG